MQIRIPRPVPRLPVVPPWHGWEHGVHRVLSCVTVGLDPSAGPTADLKQAAVDRVQDWLALGKRIGQVSPYNRGHNSATILVSRSLASWLDDHAFVSRLIAATGMASGASVRYLSVLAAAVDEVPRYDRRLDFYCSSEGISVLRGNANRVLPDLWNSGASETAALRPSLEFHPPGYRWAGPLAVTVPLANTVFTSGRPHMLYASRWRTMPGELPSLTEKIEKAHQKIVLPSDAMGFDEDSIGTFVPNLVPLTPAREIRSGFGNILRELQFEGQPRPASVELESLVPLLLEHRRRRREDGHDGGSPNGPLGIWALLIPRQYVYRRLPTPKPIDLKRYKPSDEMSVAKEARDMMDMLLGGGCQLRKVLSGGGGWGPKQGLLSLDPQTKFVADEDQETETFIRNFEASLNSWKSQPPHDIMETGSCVQFFVEAAYPEKEEWAEPFTRSWDPSEVVAAPTAVFGTPGPVVKPSPLSAVTTWPSLFGAVSSEVYVTKRREQEEQQQDKQEEILEKQQEKLGQKQEPKQEQEQEPTQKDEQKNEEGEKDFQDESHQGWYDDISTKLDSASSYLISTARFRHKLGSEIQGDLLRRSRYVVKRLPKPPPDDPRAIAAEEHRKEKEAERKAAERRKRMEAIVMTRASFLAWMSTGKSKGKAYTKQRNSKAWDMRPPWLKKYKMNNRKEEW